MDLFTLENFFNLLMLVFLQAVLGFDNLLYISLQSKRAPLEKQKFVRFWGIIMAVLFRIVLLFVVVILIDKLKEPFFAKNFEITMRCDISKAAMAIENNKDKIYGFQFHPESFLTINGNLLIKKILSA